MVYDSTVAEAGRLIANAIRAQRPRVVAVPLVFMLSAPLDAKQLETLAKAVKRAFDEALNEA